MATFFGLRISTTCPGFSNTVCIAKNANEIDPDFVGIGMQNLISKRKTHPVLIHPNGVLSDYIPFYFTPRSVMMFNIHTGYNEVVQRPNEDIIILVTSIHRLMALEVPFVFTNSHVYLAEADFFDTVDDLDRLDWELLQRGDFKTDPDDPGKRGRYQAETLIHRHMPVDALLGIACYNEKRKEPRHQNS